MTLIKLLDLLKMIDKESFPLIYEDGILDTRPDSIYEVVICFMCEEETWIRCHIKNEILVPWYDCEVKCVEPFDEKAIQVWLDDEKYLLDNFPGYIKQK